MNCILDIVYGGLRTSSIIASEFRKDLQSKKLITATVHPRTSPSYVEALDAPSASAAASLEVHCLAALKQLHKYCKRGYELQGIPGGTRVSKAVAAR